MGDKNKPTEKEIVNQVTPDSAASLERERLTSLINSMADGVFALDQNCKILIYNGAALNLLDINMSLLNINIGRVVNLVDGGCRKIDLTKLIRSLKTQKVTSDYRLAYKDGTFANVYLSIAPVRLGFGRGGTEGYVIVMRDITHEKSLEEERDEFISVVSHELRTPVTIAEGNIGNVEFLVKKSNLDKQISKALSQAHEQIVFLSSLINDLSTLSRAERGDLKVEKERINAHDLIHELASNYKASASAKGLTIKTNLSPDLKLVCNSPLYVREILQNFITNAIKYTEKGYVSLSAKPMDKGVLFEVSDTGIGVSKSDKEKIFDKFFRSEDFRTRENAGTGLGLYVTSKLARLIGAKISLESELNKGSVFSIFIPNLD